jgi:chromosome segregation ATPase
MTDEQLTLGEISRTLKRMESDFAESNARHHAQIQATNASLSQLTTKMDEYIGPVAVLKKQAADAEQDIKDIRLEVKAIDTRVGDSAKNAAFLSGGISMLGFLFNVFKKTQ